MSADIPPDELEVLLDELHAKHPEIDAQAAHVFASIAWLVNEAMATRSEREREDK
jgi:hypothetical protein